MKVGPTIRELADRISRGMTTEQRTVVSADPVQTFYVLDGGAAIGGAACAETS